jgi:tetratricopeptide (TPR) repeat protein
MRSLPTLGFLSFLLLCLTPVPAPGVENPFEQGVREYRQENFEEALDYFRAARVLAPDSSAPAFYLGLTLKQTGDYPAAAKNLREALRLSPPVQEAHVELVEVLYGLGEMDEAEERIAEAEEAGIKPPHIAFLKGLVLAKKGDVAGATEAFDRSGALDPTLAQASSLQVAMLQVRDSRPNQARESLEAVIQLDPASDLAGFAREYQRSLEQALRAYKAWRLEVGAAYQYDDNVVNKPDSATGIPAADNITDEADSSLVATFQADYNPRLDGPWTLGLNYNFYSNTHSDLDSHDLLTHAVSVVPGVRSGAAALTLPLTFSYVRLDDEGYLRLLAVRPTYSRQLAPGHIGQFSLRYDRREMLQTSLDPDEDRDADIYGVSLGYVRTFSQERGAFNLRYEGFRENTEGRNWESHNHRLSASLLLPLRPGLSLTGSGEVLWQDYLRGHTSFDEEREDVIYSAAGGFIWEPRRGLKVNLQYAHTRDDSNIPIYDYTRNVYTVGVNYAF